MRTKITNFVQMEGEPFHEAWDRFKQLFIQCPHHHYLLQLQKQFFYDGLTPQYQYMVDNTVGGTMGEKTIEETVELYEMLGANSQHCLPVSLELDQFLLLWGTSLLCSGLKSLSLRLLVAVCLLPC